MHRQKYYVEVKTEKKLTLAENKEIMDEFNNRLQGYSYNPLACLKDADIRIGREITDEEIMESLLDLNEPQCEDYTTEPLKEKVHPMCEGVGLEICKTCSNKMGSDYE